MDLRIVTVQILNSYNKKETEMKFIGITGGVGAGKSAVLSYLAKRPGVRVMLADEIAHELMEPQTACGQKIAEVFAEEDIFSGDGGFDRGKLAACIFGDAAKRETLNGIVHPAVKEYVLEQLGEERRKGQLSYLFLEAALLIEEHYGAICDELWYIYTSEENRRARLLASRGYSDGKIDGIFKSQLSEAEYRTHCRIVIDNNGTPEQTFEQIDKFLRRSADE
jgi:dephospho-CoA kinase